MSVNTAVVQRRLQRSLTGDTGYWLRPALEAASWALGRLDLSRVEVVAGALVGTLVRGSPVMPLYRLHLGRTSGGKKEPQQKIGKKYLF